ncbi:MAG: BatA domain-containing protein, partial [Methanoregula sp.]|nr:BatA domain-containing protein [Methanoregula sp.]
MSGFYEPAWLFALLLLPVLAGVYWYITRKKKQEAIAFSRIAFVKSALGDARKSKRAHILFIVALAVISLLVIGLADPHIPLEQTKEGTNVILVLDISGSMQASDYQPTRIEAAKTAAGQLVRSLDPKDSVGV